MSAPPGGQIYFGVDSHSLNVERHYAKQASGNWPGCLNCEEARPLHEWKRRVAAALLPGQIHALSVIDLIVEIRSNSANDHEFAQRIALACATLTDQLPDRNAGEVIREAFGPMKFE